MLWQKGGYTGLGFRGPMELNDLEKRRIGLSMNDCAVGGSGAAGGGNNDEEDDNDSFYEPMEGP